MSDTKAREFWLYGQEEPLLAKSNLSAIEEGHYFSQYPKTDLIHVIEKSAYDDMRDQAEKLAEALKFVRERENYAFAECAIAEELWSKCNTALAEYEAFKKERM